MVDLRIIALLAVAVLFGAGIGASAVYLTRPAPILSVNEQNAVIAKAAADLLSKAAEAAAALAVKKGLATGSDSKVAIDAALAAQVMLDAAAKAADLVAQTARQNADIRAAAAEEIAKATAKAAADANLLAHPTVNEQSSPYAK